MELPAASDGHNASVPQGHLNDPQKREAVSPEPYDNMDDVLLLSMAQINDDALSPNSKKVIEKNTASFTVAASVDASRTTPLVIQRPPSSGLNITGFNYARPARHSAPFSLRPPREQSSVKPRPKNNSTGGNSGVSLQSVNAECACSTEDSSL